jgi:hypothetical protein
VAARKPAGRSLIAFLAASLAMSGCAIVADPPLQGNNLLPVESAADLHCSLPVRTDDHIGFVDFPSGQYREDPSGPVGGPTNNHFGVFYDYQAHTWIRTGTDLGNEFVSPDGSEVAQLDSGPVGSGPNGVQRQGFTDVYLLTVLTQARRHVGVIPGTAYLIAFRSDGLYVDDFGPDANGRPLQFGVYRFDLRTGRTARIGPNGPGSSTAVDLWNRITSAAVWRSLLAIPNQYDANPVQSMSRSDGRVTTWYTAPSRRSVAIVGFARPDEPLVAEFDTEPYDQLHHLQFMVLPEPNAVQQVSIDPSTSPFGLTDAMGIWLAGPGRLWLYNGAGLIAMANLSSGPLGSETPAIAGRCS